MEDHIQDNHQRRPNEISASNNTGAPVSVSIRGRETHEKGFTAVDQKDTSASEAERIAVSVTYRGGVRNRPNYETTNLAEKCDPQKNACARIKHKTSVRKQYKKWIKKLSKNNRSQHNKKQKNICKTNMTEDPQRTEKHCSNLFFKEEQSSALKISQSEFKSNCKEHVIDEEDTDVDCNDMRKFNRVSNAGNFFDLWNDNQKTPNENQSQDVHPYIASGRLNTSSTNIDSFLAPFLSRESTVNTQEIHFDAENEDDVKLFQILQYVKHSEGGINLLYDFIQSHLRFVNGQETANHEDDQNSSHGDYNETESIQYHERNSEHDATDGERLSDEQEVYRNELHHDTRIVIDDYDEIINDNCDSYNNSLEGNETEGQELNNQARYCQLDDSITESDSDKKSFQQYESRYYEELEDSDEEDNCNANDSKIDTESDTNSFRQREIHCHKIENYLDNTSTCGSEITESIGSRSKEDCSEAGSNSSGSFSEIFPSEVLPYISFTSSSTSVCAENSISSESVVVDKISVGVQTDFQINFQYTSSTSKIYNREHYSHQQKKTYITGSCLTTKSKLKRKKYRNSPLKNRLYRTNLKLLQDKNRIAFSTEESTPENKKTYITDSYVTTKSKLKRKKYRNSPLKNRLYRTNLKLLQDKRNIIAFSTEESTPENKILESDTSNHFCDTTNSGCSLNRMEDCRVFTRADKDFEDSKSDNELIDLIDKAQIEIIGISETPTISDESENGLLDSLEKVESEIFGISNIQEESKNKPTSVRLQYFNVINKIDKTSETKEEKLTETDMDFTIQALKIKSGHEQIQEKIECPVWNIIKELESPFKWAPDILILEGSDNKLQDNIIEHLTKKEKEFSKAKKNVFRETIVHLVLAYEKILDNNLVEAMADVQHCFSLLDYKHIPEIITEHSAIQEIEENSNKHEYFFCEMKQRRQNMFYNTSNKILQQPSFSDNDKLKQVTKSDASSFYVTDFSMKTKDINSTADSETSYQLTSKSGDSTKAVIADAAVGLGNKEFDSMCTTLLETSNRNKNKRVECNDSEAVSYPSITTSYEKHTLPNGMIESSDNIIPDNANEMLRADDKNENTCPLEMRKAECDNKNTTLKCITSTVQQNIFTELRDVNEKALSEFDTEGKPQRDSKLNMNKVDHISICENSSLNEGNKTENYVNLNGEYISSIFERMNYTADELDTGNEAGIVSVRENYFKESLDESGRTEEHRMMTEIVDDFNTKKVDFTSKQSIAHESIETSNKEIKKIADTHVKLQNVVQNFPNTQQNANKKNDEIIVASMDNTNSVCRKKGNEQSSELNTENLSVTADESCCYENPVFNLNEDGLNDSLTRYKPKMIKTFEEFDNSGNNCLKLKKAEEQKTALECVVGSVLAHVAYFSGSYKESHQVAKFFGKKYEKLGNVGKATILAVKGAMILEYGYSGSKLGLEFIKKAHQMDPDHWEWNLLCGKIIGRIRRVEGINGRKPTEEELGYLQKSVELYREDASALVHLANMYRTLSHFLHKESLEAQDNNKSDSVMKFRPYVRRGGRRGWSVSWRSQPEEEMNPMERWRNPQQIPMPRPIVPLQSDQKDYLQLAKNLFLEALDLEPNCPYNNARCAKGLWSMPNPYRDKDLAQKAIFQAIFLAPEDTLVNHYAGLFYEFCHDYEKALECYKKSFSNKKCNYPAELCYINLRLRTSCPGSYNPLHQFSSLVHKYPSSGQTLQTLCHQGFYCYKVEGRYFLAIRYIVEAIKIYPESQILKTFYPGTFYGQIPPSYNMYDLLEEIVVKYKSLPEAVEKEDYINKALETARKLRPQVLHDKLSN